MGRPLKWLAHFLFAMPFFVLPDVSAAVTNVSLEPDLIRSEPGSNPAYGKFYGYRTLEEGPGADAFQKCLDLANKWHVPLVVVCSRDDCTHCTAFNDNMNKEKEKLFGWMATRSVIFAYFKCNANNPNVPQASHDALQFLVNVCGLHTSEIGIVTPYFGIYYKPSSSSSPKTSSGTLALGTWGETYTAQTVSMFIQQMDLQFSTLAPDAYIRTDDPDPVPGDACFGCGSSESARLEAMPSTETVYVPIVRTNNLAAAASGTLEAVFPDETTFTTNFTWDAASGAAQTMEIAVPVVDLNIAGDVVKLKLLDGDGMIVATNSITCVEEEANRQRFPYWLGERTEDTLAWGEWTFDLDVATNKVRKAAASGTNAWTLAVVAGTLWCPNCEQCEQCVFDRPEFTAWAQANHVSLVLLDQPNNYGATGPTLLTHTLGTSGLGRGRSGSYYLSRKGLAIGDGRRLFDRIHELSWTRAPQGWLVEPGANRVSNPTMILIRPDGRIAGRLTACRIAEAGVSTNNERFDLEENLSRLTELLELGGDEAEEKNNKAITTDLPYRYGATNVCSLQVSDRADVFRLESVPPGEVFRICSESSAGAKSSPEFSLLVVTNRTTGACRAIESFDEDVPQWRLTESQVVDGLYLQVSAFSAEEESRYGKYGGDSAFTTRFWTEVVPPDPGVVGFATNEVRVSESAGKLVLTVVRTRGASGAASVRIDLDPDGTTASEGSYVWDSGDAAAHTLSWDDFEHGARTLAISLVDDDIWTDDRRIAFRMVPLGESGVETGIDRLVADILEDEMLSPGIVEIAATSPAPVKGLVVEVQAGGVLAVAARRAQGNFGEATVGVSVSHPGVTPSASSLTWDNWESGLKTVSFVLPDASAFLENPVFTIELCDVGSVPVAPARHRITVHAVLPESCASLDQRLDEMNFETPQGFAFSKTFRISNPALFSSAARVVAVSGALPKGLEAAWDADSGELTVSGTVRRQGEYEVTLRLEEGGTDGAKTSLPVALNISAPPLSSLSPLLADAHDFRDLPVVGVDPIDGAKNVLHGLLDVAIPLSGRLSARYRRSDGSSVRFAFDGWDGVDGNGSVFAHATSLEAACCGQPQYSMRISTAVDDSNTFDISLYSAPDGGRIDVTAQKSPPWSLADSAVAWTGVYTIACMPTEHVFGHTPDAGCAGAPTFSCRMMQGAAASGRVTYAGVLPDGVRISGSSRLVRGETLPVDGIPYVTLPVFAVSGDDAFGGLFRIRAEGSRLLSVVRSDPSTTPFWRHWRTSGNSGEALSQVFWYDAHGSWFDTETDWSRLLHESYFKTSLPFCIYAGDSGTASATVVADGADLVVSPSGNIANVQMEFNRSTGQIRGRFADPDTGGQVDYFGVLTPGWLAGCDCGGDTPEEDTERPFAAGAWWSRAIGTYEDTRTDGSIATVGSALIGNLVTIEDIKD